MATSTTRLLLRKPATSDTVNVVTDINDGADIIDLNIGCRICTSGSRPSTPFQGMQIYETDTRLVRFWNGAAWRFVGGEAPIAVLTKNAVQSIPHAATTAVTFPTESLDTHSGHDLVTNNSRYTAQIAGRYKSYGVMTWAGNATGRRALSARKNAGAIINETVAPPSASAFGQGIPTQFFDLAVSDYIELTCFQDSGVALNLNDVDSSWSVEFMGDAYT